ncbi:MAG: hypothetical protein ACKVQK_20390 [Burkholderiales bacterium]
MNEPNDIPGESRDLLDKTDALLGRYRGGAKNSSDSEFPVLTEVLGANQAIPTLHEPTVTNEPPVLCTELPKFVDEDRLLREVMLALEPKITEILGAPLKVRIEEHVRDTLESVAEKVRVEVEALVRIAVSRAIEQVLSDKNKP